MKTTRRAFIRSVSVSTAALSFPAIAKAQQPPSGRLRVGVMGLSRGLGHIRALAKVPNVEIAYVCDVDAQRLAKGAKIAEDATGTKPQAVGDFRRILEDAEIDALTTAAPNFWHAPATILACEAGKHVYVEKPGSYCPDEALRITAAARQHKRKVQQGTQRRSYPKLLEAMARLREGVIGELRAARCWYSNQRPSIGKGNRTQAPAHLDYELWQGPVPARPYKDNLVHYNWHWHWHWGNGELGNNGVHALDVARWGMGVDLPRRVACTGGRYHHADDQETPDTAVAAFDFGDVSITWDGSSCLPRKEEKLPFVKFYGEGGTLAVDGGNSYRIHDRSGKEIENHAESASDVPHFRNFADAIREDAPLNAEIEVAQKAALMCHLGNISYRSGTTVDIDPADPRPTSDAARTLWTRAYREYA